MNEHSVLLNPKAKTSKPQGQLAAMLQSRGWDENQLIGSEINRSSSAPPTQLRNFEDDLNTGYESSGGTAQNQFAPAQNSWNLWAPPANQTSREPQLFAPNPVSNPIGQAWGNASPLSAPSPLRAQKETSSPLRMGGAYRDQTFNGPPGIKPAANQFRDFDNEDEIRMKQMLQHALDPRDDLFGGPIPRSSSTPPTRLQFAAPSRYAQDTLGMQNLDINERQSRRPGGRFDNVHTTTSAHFPPEKNSGYARDFEMLQLRSKPQGVYEQDFLPRPASAQGRFVSPASRAFAPPGLDGGSDGIDPAMAQALATLSAAGNLTPQQIAQIQMQLRINSPVGGQSANRQRTQPNIHRTASPARSRRDQSPGGDTSPVRSALLEEFRASKNRKYELKDILGSMVEFSCDQHGSRFIQQKLESASDADRQLVFIEIYPEAIHLTTDVFGNYVIQKFFEHGSPEQKQLLAKQMEGQILNLSLQMYGCRVVQKAFEYVAPEQQATLIKELEGNVLKCVKDQNGNHVIQKAVERVDASKIKFIIDAFYGQVYALATHPYGCRVIQRIFEYCSEDSTDPLMEELHKYAISLIQDQYGNYVIQHILEKGKPKDRQFVISKVKGNVLNMSKHKFASNVVEKCVSFGTTADRKEILDEVITTKPDGTTALYTMMKDQFANYVVQKLLDVSSEQQRILLVTKIKPQLPSLKKYTYGKHLITKVEKYLAQYKIDN